jgi:hypothetical protein
LRRFRSCGALLLGAAALPCLAQQERAPQVQPKLAAAARVPSGSLRIDGRLEEEAWQAATPLEDFVQREPNQGEPATDAMQVRFVYDASALYVGARMAARARADVQAPVSRRDDGHQAEHLLISLDTFHDRRTAYTFGVTAAGVRLDYFFRSDNEYDIDAAFDPVWEAKTSVDDSGWTAEMRIPFSQLRFNDVAQQVWGLNVDRWIPSRYEDVFWVLVPKGENAWASRFGTLVGISGIRPSRRIELLPYAASNGTLQPDAAGDPFHGGFDAAGRLGGDLKLGLGPNLTLEATFNPDFGQVEADPAEVNLTAFETFFEEKRPFFIEGRNLLEYGDYVYSRRIGAQPRGPAPFAFVDYPSASTILGAGKLSGRLPSGLSLGLLGALTGREHARVAETEAAPIRTLRVAPFTSYGVLRGVQQLGAQQSTAGVVLTGVHRNLAASDPLASLLTRDAVAASGDFDWRFSDASWSLRGDLGLSHVAGEPEAVLRLQRSSARYYQRPDATHVALDPERRSLSGYRAGLLLERLKGKHWFGFAELRAISPGFEVNDLGSLSRSGEVFAAASLLYRETRRTRAFHEWGTELFSLNRLDWGGSRELTSLTSNTTLTWRNFWFSQIVMTLNARAQDTRLTRGGPAMGTPRRFSVGATQRSRSSGRTFWRLGALVGGSENGDRSRRVNGQLTLRPGPRFRLQITPQDQRSTEARQYVATLDGGRTETYGRRYVFAFIDRRTLSAQVRLTYLFKPDLSLDLYAEPFAATGRYYDHGELARPGARELATYGRSGTRVDVDTDGSRLVHDGATSFALANRDFVTRSFRSNLVLRWEWRLGSTLFLVWQQNRAGSAAIGERASLGDFLASFGERGDNVFAVKASFWLPLE